MVSMVINTDQARVGSLFDTWLGPQSVLIALEPYIYWVYAIPIVPPPQAPQGLGAGGYELNCFNQSL